MSQPTIDQWTGALNAILRAKGVTQHAFVCRRVQRQSTRSEFLEYHIIVQPNPTRPDQAGLHRFRLAHTGSLPPSHDCA